MTPDKSEWTAPQVTPITEADGAAERPTARSRNAVISGDV